MHVVKLSPGTRMTYTVLVETLIPTQPSPHELVICLWIDLQLIVLLILNFCDIMLIMLCTYNVSFQLSRNFLSLSCYIRMTSLPH